MHGKHISRMFHYVERCSTQGKRLVTGGGSLDAARQHAVDEDFGIVVVVNHELKIAIGARLQVEAPPQPDVARLPSRAYTSTRRVFRAKAGAALLPGRIIIIRSTPVSTGAFR